MTAGGNISDGSGRRRGGLALRHFGGQAWLIAA